MVESTLIMAPIEIASHERPLRFITAASLFDGHDAAINIMRRLLQSSGVEVVHLGHNRSVADIVNAAVQEDADAIAVSSYQGGHNEYFRYCIELLAQSHASHIRVFGGGGGTITPSEIEQLQRTGVTRIYSPEDGRQLGLQGIISDMIERCKPRPKRAFDWNNLGSFRDQPLELSRLLTAVEEGQTPRDGLGQLFKPFPTKGCVVGITGTGGAGKSSLTDELVLRLLAHNPRARIAILAIDPTRRKTGGALLGDRLRINSLQNPMVFMRSLATRQADSSISPSTLNLITALKHAHFDWIFVETGGIGQADAAIADKVDLFIYVITFQY